MLNSEFFEGTGWAKIRSKTDWQVNPNFSNGCFWEGGLSCGLGGMGFTAIAQSAQRLRFHMADGEESGTGILPVEFEV